MRYRIAILIALLVTVGACQSSTDTTRSTGKVIDYGKSGVVLKSAADVSKLKGAPQDFKTFIAAFTTKTTEVGPSAQFRPQVLVYRIDPAGFAYGAVRDIEGAEYIWSKKSGKWKTLWADNTDLQCSAMKSNHVPKSVVGKTCWNGKKSVPYNG